MQAERGFCIIYPKSDLRTGIATGFKSVNDHLKSIGLKILGLCEICLKENGNPTHFLCDCPAFTQVRHFTTSNFVLKNLLVNIVDLLRLQSALAGLECIHNIRSIAALSYGEVLGRSTMVSQGVRAAVQWGTVPYKYNTTQSTCFLFQIEWLADGPPPYPVQSFGFGHTFF